MQIDSSAEATGFSIDYKVNQQAHNYALQLPQPRLSHAEAALHLMALHFGDAENSLLMPNADASAEQILAQAAVMGITDIQVTSE
jgi:hypothetical protein